ncbi:hypothetical protein [Spongiivirga citrea]|uniref:Uncharacterized protein n=1 Tax=Spongiivirga citrea TaxID=1481457 RepID=A0A6M0CNB9_9FLAO|nr:hypothetical protein [Spongiivirga citrea]NER18443.1 hypothetical protein [Spongiivirga citrea]
MFKLNNLYIVILFCICNTHQTSTAQEASVLFNLSAKTIKEATKDNSLHIGIRGSSMPLTWVNDILLKDNNGDGIYTVTINFPIKTKTDVYFKFVLNQVEWEKGDARKLRLEPGTTTTYEAEFNYESRPGNPFEKFIGTWSLKDNSWEQGNKDETTQLKIYEHQTVCKELNTDNSLLWTVNAPSARGHILWVYNHKQKKVNHLSSFLPYRSGIGKGSITKEGNVSLKIAFEGEPKNTYRLYHYNWVNDDEYVLESIQYDQSGTKTGDFYGGSFIRVDKDHFVKQKIQNILNVLDNKKTTLQEKLDVWSEDLIHMAPNHSTITSKKQLANFLEAEKENTDITMKHDIIDILSYEDTVIMRGAVNGSFSKKNSQETIPFSTKNLFVFKKNKNGILKIWKVIYNMSSNNQ